jgi:hypothetical protein
MIGAFSMSTLGVLPGPEVHSMPRLISMKDQRLMGAASRTGSSDNVYTLIEYNRIPATIVEMKPTMNAASTANLSFLDVFWRDQSSGIGSAKIITSEATVNTFVAVRFFRQLSVPCGEILTIRAFGTQ